MHGGVFYRRETHGGTTLRAIKQRVQERAFLKEMNDINQEIEEPSKKDQKAQEKAEKRRYAKESIKKRCERWRKAMQGNIKALNELLIESGLL